MKAFTLFMLLFIYVASVSAQTKLVRTSEKINSLSKTHAEKRIDSIITDAIKKEAFPGAQLLIAKDHEIIFHKTYGFHTYDSIIKVQHSDVYDLASVTKILGPLLPLMKLYEEGKIDLDKPFSTYWKSWRRVNNKRDITLRELLAHQSGLEPYVAFVNDVVKNNRPNSRFIRRKRNTRYSKQVYQNLYTKRNYNKRVFRKLKKAKVNTGKTYKYSGIASLIYPKLIENITGEIYEDYLYTNFYNPLRCNTIRYLPNKQLTIVPTEIDTLLRNTIVQGYVHDENAALLGGVSGNAGLFSNAHDAAVLMQMLVNKGVYNGIQFLKPETIEEFIKIQYPENNNRRGLGFDKPLINNHKLPITKAYPAPQVSKNSFGHGGFTGTFVWGDPDYNLVFIFLSNRVYPSRNHRNIYNLSIRPKLQQVFYKELDLN